MLLFWEKSPNFLFSFLNKNGKLVAKCVDSIFQIIISSSLNFVISLSFWVWKKNGCFTGGMGKRLLSPIFSISVALLHDKWPTIAINNNRYSNTYNKNKSTNAMCFFCNNIWQFFALGISKNFFISNDRTFKRQSALIFVIVPSLMTIFSLNFIF